MCHFLRINLCKVINIEYWVQTSQTQTEGLSHKIWNIGNWDFQQKYRFVQVEISYSTDITLLYFISLSSFQHEFIFYQPIEKIRWHNRRTANTWNTDRPLCWFDWFIFYKFKKFTILLSELPKERTWNDFWFQYLNRRISRVSPDRTWDPNNSKIGKAAVVCITRMLVWVHAKVIYHSIDEMIMMYDTATMSHVFLLTDVVCKHSNVMAPGRKEEDCPIRFQYSHHVAVPGVNYWPSLAGTVHVFACAQLRPPGRSHRTKSKSTTGLRLAVLTESCVDVWLISSLRLS